MRLQSADDLIVYQKAYSLAMEIFRMSKRLPAEERYALTGQIRRSSRSVCQNLKEAWAKRRYEAHFISKLTDCDGEMTRPILRWISRKTASTSLRLSTRNWWPSVQKSAGCWAQ